MKRDKEIKIRRQFFNELILLFIILYIFLCIIIAIEDIHNHQFYWAEYLQNIWIALGVLSICLLPLVVLSILNIFFFGRIVCVIDQTGIYYENRFLKWSDITEMRYVLSTKTRSIYRPSSMKVQCGDHQVCIEYAPLLLYCYARKYGNHIKLKIE